jgi:hypothetical protein
MNLHEPSYEAFKIEFPMGTLRFTKIGWVVDIVWSHLVSFVGVVPFHHPNLFRGANKPFMLLHFKLLFEKLLYGTLRVYIPHIPVWVSLLDSAFGLFPQGWVLCGASGVQLKGRVLIFHSSGPYWHAQLGQTFPDQPWMLVSVEDNEAGKSYSSPKPRRVQPFFETPQMEQDSEGHGDVSCHIKNMPLNLLGYVDSLPCWSRGGSLLQEKHPGSPKVPVRVAVGREGEVIALSHMFDSPDTA